MPHRPATTIHSTASAYSGTSTSDIRSTRRPGAPGPSHERGNRPTLFFPGRPGRLVTHQPPTRESKPQVKASWNGYRLYLSLTLWCGERYMEEFRSREPTRSAATRRSSEKRSGSTPARTRRPAASSARSTTTEAGTVPGTPSGVTSSPPGRPARTALPVRRPPQLWHR